MIRDWAFKARFIVSSPTLLSREGGSAFAERRIAPDVAGVAGSLVYLLSLDARLFTKSYRPRFYRRNDLPFVPQADVS